MAKATVPIAGTIRHATVEAGPVGPADPATRITTTVYARRNPALAPMRSPLEQAALPHGSRTYLSDDQASLLHGADPRDLDAIVAFARRQRLEVVERSEAKRMVRVAGTVAAMGRAFGVELEHFEHPLGVYRSHMEPVQLPADLAAVVDGVLGLDNRKMARSYLRRSALPAPRRRGRATAAAAPSLPANAYFPPAVAELFDFPAVDGTGQCVAVFAFNGQVMSTGQSVPGGYDATALNGYYTTTLGQSAPTLVDVVVQGPGNQPGDGSNPGDTTGEVLLDLCIVGSVVPGARIAVYFTEFTEEGWVNALKAAVADTTNAPSVISISYGNPEDDQQRGLWMPQTVQLVNDALQQAAQQGMTICCASGDNGAADEPGATTDHVDFPASSPWVLGVGGTRLEADPQSGSISLEAVWNDLARGEGATGGGVSRLFPLPSWQSGAGVPPNADGSGQTGRGVPDVASVADPETPFWVLQPDGSLNGVGGTSAAAPLWSALVARLNQATGARLGYFNQELYTRVSGSLHDITQGNNSGNGISGYNAGPGWDACTGWGRPDGAKLQAALTPATPPSPPPTPTPTPTPAPSPTPTPAPAPAPTPTPSAISPREFAEPQPGADEASFQVDNTSAQYYNSPYYKTHKNQVQPVPAPRTQPPRIDLTEILDPSVVSAILATNRIAFHAVGDTGAAKVNAFQTAAKALASEASVADAMAADLHGANPPSFFFHLGDVVYNFGEGQYYYDQFYEPFRAYAAPIFAIPGNHDGMVFGSSTDLPQIPTLTAFLRNFCAPQPAQSPDAGALIRSAMTQPGVYFTLDAPFVSIIGLYSNVLEGPGVISSPGGTYPIGDEQLQFLTDELSRLKPARDAGERAVVVACHHPPASADAQHGGTTGLSNDIDAAARASGLWPDAVLSGHAHLYQRFTRAVGGRQIPYVVSGSGGFAATRPQSTLPPAPFVVGEFTLEIDPIVEFGYLTVSVDMTTTSPTLAIAFQSRDSTKRDEVTVALSTGTITSPVGGAPARRRVSRGGGRRSGTSSGG